MANLIVEQKSVKELFQGSKCDFLIPDYQRPYEWGDVECKTLWDDLFAFCFPENDCTKFKGEEYFLGPIVTFKNAGKMEVIDGQQRLTTLMLLLRAFYNKLEKMQDPDTQEMKRDIEKCIWHSDELGKTQFNNLKIDSQVATDDDKEEFLNILKSGQANATKSRYARNFDYFVKNIDNFINYYPSFFAYFPARVLSKCVLLPIEAESQDTALRIFSTLNDRGKPLADADIFKAQLYKYFSSIGKKNILIDKWKELDKISCEIFTPTYGTPLDELFTKYMYYERALTGTKNTTTEGLRKFYEGDGTYPLLRREATVGNLESLVNFWKSVYTGDEERFSERVRRLLFVLMYAPNSMWTHITSVYFLHNRNAQEELEEEPFCRFLSRTTAFIWAYSITNPGIISLRTPIFAEMVNIVNNKEVTFADFRFDEQQYRSIANNYEFNNSRAITKSMLAWWAYRQEGQELLPIETRFDIEHIYPRNRLEKEKSLKNHRNIELLGNKALLEKRINIGASDYRFADKWKYYEGFTTNKGFEKKGTKIVELLRLCEQHTDFTEEDIIARNAKIIDAFVDYLRQNDLLRK
ncbi:MAG: DUF262 domain-containing HNH endonuclease family protein [Prevotella sp.]|nr:DUF262 domain-containing HNH endonuclease family protein [Prevotella sp.]